jgi:hypothetical protein
VRCRRQRNAHDEGNREGTLLIRSLLNLNSLCGASKRIRAESCATFDPTGSQAYHHPCRHGSCALDVERNALAFAARSAMSRRDCPVSRGLTSYQGQVPRPRALSARVARPAANAHIVDNCTQRLSSHHQHIVVRWDEFRRCSEPWCGRIIHCGSSEDRSSSFTKSFGGTIRGNLVLREHLPPDSASCITTVKG